MYRYIDRITMNSDFRKNYDKVKKFSKEDLAFPSPATIRSVYELFKSHDWLYVIRLDEDDFKHGFQEYSIVLFYANKNSIFKEMYTDFHEYAVDVIMISKLLPPKPKLDQYKHR